MKQNFLLTALLLFVTVTAPAMTYTRVQLLGQCRQTVERLTSQLSREPTYAQTVAFASDSQPGDLKILVISAAKEYRWRKYEMLKLQLVKVSFRQCDKSVEQDTVCMDECKITSYKNER